MTVHRWKDIKSRKGKIDESTRARIEADAETQAVTFRALREEAGLSQAQVAELANMTQREVSRFEQRGITGSCACARWSRPWAASSR